MEIPFRKICFIDCKRSNLNAPGSYTPLCHPLLGYITDSWGALFCACKKREPVNGNDHVPWHAVCKISTLSSTKHCLRVLSHLILIFPFFLRSSVRRVFHWKWHLPPSIRLRFYLTRLNGSETASCNFMKIYSLDSVSLSLRRLQGGERLRGSKRACRDHNRRDGF